MRALIIEDEEALVAAFARGLRLQGMVVDMALDGRSGLDNACLNDGDVVILERNLPEMHGDEVGQHEARRNVCPFPCTAPIHTCFAAERPRRLTPYVVGPHLQYRSEW
jgi:DNA-binding NtrC family response regulator